VLKDGAEPEFGSAEVSGALRDTMRMAPVDASSFAIPGAPAQVRIIGLQPGQLITDALNAHPSVLDGHVVADPERDLAKIAVVERHHATGRIGLGLVRGFGLREGAFASTVAHDAHNLVIVGIDDADMRACCDRLCELGGGLAVARGGAVVGELALPLAGLLSDAPAAEVASGLEALQNRLQAQGVELGAPFMTLSFLALSVIPALKITDLGLVDVEQFRLVGLEL
jgi:adenine deaminase